MSTSRDCKYSWVGNNSRVIIQLSPVRPFLFPSSSNGNALRIVNCPVAHVKANSSNPFLFHSIQIKSTPHVLSLHSSRPLNFAISPLTFKRCPKLNLSSVQWIVRRYSTITQLNDCPPFKSTNHTMLPNLCPNQQLFPKIHSSNCPTLLINARFVNLSPTNLSKITTPWSKSLPNPTKLLSYCYCSPLFLSFRLSTIIFV